MSWDYTTILNIVALAVFGFLYWLYRTRVTRSGKYAKDPVCGMQVETVHAPAGRRTDHGVVYFCSDRCAHRYDEDPARYSSLGDKGSAISHRDVDSEGGQA